MAKTCSAALARKDPRPKASSALFGVVNNGFSQPILLPISRLMLKCVAICGLFKSMICSPFSFSVPGLLSSFAQAEAIVFCIVPGSGCSPLAVKWRTNSPSSRKRWRVSEKESRYERKSVEPIRDRQMGTQRGRPVTPTTDSPVHERNSASVSPEKRSA